MSDYVKREDVEELDRTWQEFHRAYKAFMVVDDADADAKRDAADAVVESAMRSASCRERIFGREMPK